MGERLTDLERGHGTSGRAEAGRKTCHHAVVIVMQDERDLVGPAGIEAPRIRLN
jgi:hypothetical protein